MLLYTVNRFHMLFISFHMLSYAFKLFQMLLHAENGQKSKTSPPPPELHHRKAQPLRGWQKHISTLRYGLIGHLVMTHFSKEMLLYC